MVYVAAFAPGESESINSVSKPYPPAPLGSELRPDAQGFLTATRKGIAEDMAQDLPESEQRILTATQGQTAASVFAATIKTAAWKSKPSWALIAGNDRAIPPQLEGHLVVNCVMPCSRGLGGRNGVAASFLSANHLPWNLIIASHKPVYRYLCGETSYRPTSGPQ